MARFDSLRGVNSKVAARAHLEELSTSDLVASGRNDDSQIFKFYAGNKDLASTGRNNDKVIN
jgi:hypothetical protein